ncbi:5'-methylthioadenosine/S-adenosylhomocysteine nucleosidase [[Mycoplasma] testudinis]|uniref:5'-methylthioadenosine/S-adenosylhomocysteine nucleosidase n=1 Tax=[Mycoplasma] testudinis TaxID=33924 RepID=UPI000697D23D|nr:5'-methylthioadenosine/S-adenosylhomocysteine nucleosidase [[Mycoplasma] testudinis]
MINHLGILIVSVEEAQGFIKTIQRHKKTNQIKIIKQTKSLLTFDLEMNQLWTSYFNQKLKKTSSRFIRVSLFYSRIGKVNAAIATTTLINNGCDLIINLGTVGGISSTCKVGDLFLVDQAFYRDFDLTPFGYKFGQVPNNPITYCLDSRLIKLTSKWLNTTQVCYQFGGVATGDNFADKKTFKLLNDKNMSFKIVDMEAAAIAQTCLFFKTPLLCLKVVSDLIDLKNNKLIHEKNMTLCTDVIGTIAKVLLFDI